MGLNSQHALLSSLILKWEHIHLPSYKCNDIESTHAVCPTNREKGNITRPWRNSAATAKILSFGFPTPSIPGAFYIWSKWKTACPLAFVWGSADQPCRSWWLTCISGCVEEQMERNHQLTVVQPHKCGLLAGAGAGVVPFSRSRRPPLEKCFSPNAADIISSCWCETETLCHYILNLCSSLRNNYTD